MVITTIYLNLFAIFGIDKFENHPLNDIEPKIEDDIVQLLKDCTNNYGYELIIFSNNQKYDYDYVYELFINHDVFISGFVLCSSHNELIRSMIYNQDCDSSYVIDIYQSVNPKTRLYSVIDIHKGICEEDIKKVLNVESEAFTLF